MDIFITFILMAVLITIVGLVTIIIVGACVYLIVTECGLVIKPIYYIPFYGLYRIIKDIDWGKEVD